MLMFWVPLCISVSLSEHRWMPCSPRVCPDPGALPSPPCLCYGPTFNSLSPLQASLILLQLGSAPKPWPLASSDLSCLPCSGKRLALAVQ